MTAFVSVSPARDRFLGWCQFPFFGWSYSFPLLYPLAFTWIAASSGPGVRSSFLITIRDRRACSGSLDVRRINDTIALRNPLPATFLFAAVAVLPSVLPPPRIQ